MDYQILVVVVLVFIISFKFELMSITRLLFGVFVAYFLCDIDGSKEYAWYAGIWHGIMFLPNLVRHCFWGSLYKAEICGTAYNVIYWILAIVSSVHFFISRYYEKKKKMEKRYMIEIMEEARRQELEKRKRETLEYSEK